MTAPLFYLGCEHLFHLKYKLIFASKKVGSRCLYRNLKCMLTYQILGLIFLVACGNRRNWFERRIQNTEL